jgi:hypothetical protein
MEVLFYSISLALFVSAILTFVLLIREALPFLNSEDQTTLRDYWNSMGGFGAWCKRDGVIGRAWSEHARSFPKSRKRLLFTVFLIAAAVSVMFYPLWLFVGGK